MHLGLPGHTPLLRSGGADSDINKMADDTKGSGSDVILSSKTDKSKPIENDKEADQNVGGLRLADGQTSSFCSLSGLVLVGLDTPK